MAPSRGCTFQRQDGSACGATPLTDEPLCFFHSPTHAKEAAEARRLGGLRRRREGTLIGAYDLDGVRTLPDLQHLLQIAIVDTLCLDNSVGRNRALGYLIGIGANLLVAQDLQHRIDQLEVSLRELADEPQSPFEEEPIESTFHFLPEEDQP